MANELYGGASPIDLPAYSIREAARHLCLPPSTLRSWVVGRDYPTARGHRRSSPIIKPADEQRTLLSFRNLVEAHVLSAIRTHHAVPLAAVREAVDYLERSLKLEHPLASAQMRTDGKSLLVEKFGELINASKDGQLEIRQAIELYLTRIERDRRSHLPVRLYPFAARNSERKVVQIDPTVQFGRPCIVGTGVPTGLVRERMSAGETIGELADDYGVEASAIEEALRYELARAA